MATVIGGGEQMAAGAEVRSNDSVKLEESLGVLAGLEPAHRFSRSRVGLNASHLNEEPNFVSTLLPRVQNPLGTRQAMSIFTICLKRWENCENSASWRSPSPL